MTMAVKDDRHAHGDPIFQITPRNATRRGPPWTFDLPTLLQHPLHSRVVGQQFLVTGVGHRLHVRPRGQFKEWQIFYPRACIVSPN